MGEIPGFSLDYEKDMTEEERFIAAGYEPEVVVSSTVGVYTIWSKIKDNPIQSNDAQAS